MMYGSGSWKSPSMVDDSAFRRLQFIARAQHPATHANKRLLQGKLRNILANKIRTMRLYYKMEAFSQWRDVTKEKVLGPAVALVQRHFKRLIALRRVAEERKVRAAKEEIFRMLTNVFNGVNKLRDNDTRYSAILELAKNADDIVT